MMKLPHISAMLLVIGALGLAGVAVYANSVSKDLESHQVPRINWNQASNLQYYLFGAPKRAFLVSNDFPCPEVECPTPFSVDPRSDSVLFI